MKKILFFLIFLILACCLNSYSLATEVNDWPHPEEMEFEEIEVAPLEAERYELNNGLVIYLMENRDLPLIEGQLYIKAGSLYDPEDMVGLASLTASLLRTGGSAGRVPDEIDEQLEYLAASIEVSAGVDSATAWFSSLTENIDEVLGVFTDILQKPDFLPERIEIHRGILFESIRRRNDQPMEIAVREFLIRVAEGHPLGWFPSVKTVERITRDDLVLFHDRFYTPEGSVLALTGDFDIDSILDVLEKTLGEWQSRERAYPEVPNFNPDPEPFVYHAQKEIEQSIIFLGHPAVLYDSESFPALSIANRILGGEGDNRLFREIRSLRGLAYAVGSGLTEGYEYPGVFYAYAISRANKTVEVIERIREQIENLRYELVGEDELERNREAVLSQAVFRYSSPDLITSRQAMIEFLDLEPDYYERYIDSIQLLDAEMVREEVERWIHPQKAIIFVVGDANRFDALLDILGEVVPVELDE